MATALQNGNLVYVAANGAQLNLQFEYEIDSKYDYVRGLVPRKAIIEKYYALVREKLDRYATEFDVGARALLQYNALVKKFSDYVYQNRTVKSTIIPNLFLFVVQAAREHIREHPDLGDLSMDFWKSDAAIEMLVKAFEGLYTNYLSQFNVLFGTNQRVSFAFELVAQVQPNIGAHYEAFCRFPCKTTATYLKTQLKIPPTILQDTTLTREQLAAVLSSHWQVVFPQKKVIPLDANPSAFTLPAPVQHILKTLRSLASPVTAWWNLDEHRPRTFVTTTDVPEVHAFLLGPSKITATALQGVIQPPYKKTPLVWWNSHVKAWHQKEFPSATLVTPNFSLGSYGKAWTAFLDWYNDHETSIRNILEVYPLYKEEVWIPFLKDPTLTNWSALKTFQHPLAQQIAQEFSVVGEKSDPPTLWACLLLAGVLEKSQLASTTGKTVTWNEKVLTACKVLQPFKAVLERVQRVLLTTTEEAAVLQEKLSRAMTVVSWLCETEPLATLAAWNGFAFWTQALETAAIEDLCVLMAGIMVRYRKYPTSVVASLADWDQTICDAIKSELKNHVRV